jgi:hypothetical protein
MRSERQHGMRRRWAAAAALALLLAGCQLGPRRLSAPADLPSGEWAIVAIRFGHANVRDPNEAIARYGQVIRYEADRAVSGGETCDAPTYLASAIVADRYLRAEYGMRAADFGLHGWQDVRVTEVYCNGRRWRPLGGEAFWVGHDRGYAVRDDVLYELRRTKAPDAQ